MLVLAAALWIDYARQAAAADRVEWRDFSQTASAGQNGTGAELHGQEQRRSQNRPRLIYFTADQCGPCQVMKADVFSKSQVANAIHTRFEPFVVNLSQPTPREYSLAETYGVQFMPTLIVTDDRGQALERLDGVVDAAGFLRWLNRGWQAWARHQQDTSSTPEGTALTINRPAP